MVVVTDVEQLIVAIEVTAQRDDGGCIVPQEQSGAERREFGHPAAGPAFRVVAHHPLGYSPDARERDEPDGSGKDELD